MGFNDAGTFIRLKRHHSVHLSDEDETKEKLNSYGSSVKLSRSSALDIGLRKG